MSFRRTYLHVGFCTSVELQKPAHLVLVSKIPKILVLGGLVSIPKMSDGEPNYDVPSGESSSSEEEEDQPANPAHLRLSNANNVVGAHRFLDTDEMDNESSGNSSGEEDGGINGIGADNEDEEEEDEEDTASANCERLANSLPDRLQQNGREVFAAMAPEVVAAAVEELDDLERRRGAMTYSNAASAERAAAAEASSKRKRKELEHICEICNISRPVSDYNVRLYTPASIQGASECHTNFTDYNTGTVHAVAPNPRPSADAPRSTMSNRSNRSSYDRQHNTGHECRHCLSGTLTHRKCRSCQVIQPLDMFNCIVTGQANWWRTCSACRTTSNPLASRDSYNARYRDLRAVTHGYLCPIFTSYVQASSPWNNMETPLDQVALSTDAISRDDVVGEYNIQFYVGGKLDIGPKVFSRRCGGTVILTVEDVTDQDGHVTKKLKGNIQLGNGRVRMPHELERKGPRRLADYGGKLKKGKCMHEAMDAVDRKKMADRRAADFALATRIDQHSEHHNWYRPSSGAMNFTECTANDVANHSGLIALGRDHVNNRQKERTQIPGDAVAFKLDPKSSEKADRDRKSASGDNARRGRESLGSFRLGAGAHRHAEDADDAEVFPSSEPVHGFITTVATRAAIPRCRDDRYVRAMWHKIPDTLTFEQGDAIMERYNDVGRSWLCRRLRLPEPAAMNVRKFLKPEPVHFFEPGDLWIRFVYSERGRDKGHPALIVARRKD